MQASENNLTFTSIRRESVLSFESDVSIGNIKDIWNREHTDVLIDDQISNSNSDITEASSETPTSSDLSAHTVDNESYGMNMLETNAEGAASSR